MFLWLVVAFVVDGIGRPLARRYDVKKNWPAYDGVLMDLIIDYLTYVFIPAFALFQSGLLSGWTGWFAIIVIVFTSVRLFRGHADEDAGQFLSRAFPAAGTWSSPGSCSRSSRTGPSS